MRRATALAVPVRRLSLSISSYFHAVGLHSLCVPRSRKLKKNTKNLDFDGSRSFKVIDFDTIKRLVTSARYDKQHDCVFASVFTLHQPIAVKEPLLGGTLI